MAKNVVDTKRKQVVDTKPGRKRVSKHVMSAKERSARHKAKLAKQGLVQIALWVPKRTVADFKLVAQLAVANAPNFSARPVNLTTGRVKRMK
jgi:hypothetical protein